MRFPFAVVPGSPAPPVDPCGLVVDFGRRCAKFKWKPWVDSDTTVTIRTYRVAPGTPSIGLWHTAGTPDWLPYRPKDLIPINPGIQPYPATYDKGAPPLFLPTKGKPCGTPAAWVAAYTDLNPPLVYDPLTGVALCCGVPPLPAVTGNLLLESSRTATGHLALAGPAPAPRGSMLLASPLIPAGMLALSSPAMTPAGSLLLAKAILPKSSQLVLTSTVIQAKKLELCSTAAPSGHLLLASPAPAPAGKLLFASQAIPSGRLLLSGNTTAGKLQFSAGTAPPAGELLFASEPVPDNRGRLELASTHTLAGALELADSHTPSGLLLLASPAVATGNLSLRSTMSPAGCLELVDPRSPAGRLELVDPRTPAGLLLLSQPPPPHTITGNLVLSGSTSPGSLLLAPVAGITGNLVLESPPPPPAPAAFLVFAGNAYAVNTSSAYNWPTAPFSMSVRFRTTNSPGLPAFLFIIGFGYGSGLTQSFYFYQQGGNLYASSGAGSAAEAAVAVNDGAGIARLPPTTERLSKFTWTVWPAACQRRKLLLLSSRCFTLVRHRSPRTHILATCKTCVFSRTFLPLRKFSQSAQELWPLGLLATCGSGTALKGLAPAVPTPAATVICWSSRYRRIRLRGELDWRLPTCRRKFLFSFMRIIP